MLHQATAHWIVMLSCLGHVATLPRRELASQDSRHLAGLHQFGSRTKLRVAELCSIFLLRVPFGNNSMIGWHESFLRPGTSDSSASLERQAACVRCNSST